MRDNDSLILENLYTKKILLNEISSEFVDEVKDAVEDKELPFNNIFGDKLRIKVPLKGTGEYSDILDKISQIKNFDHFDSEKKEVVKKIEVDPKYGGGVKYQKINLGRAISSLNIPEDEKKKMLDWFANYSSNIPEMENMGKYTIVITRSPIDLLRMSDIGSIRSCHSQGGQYFHCAISEAKNGGAIAYLVKTSDLKKLSEDEFQNEEIFSDPQRNVEGLNAISRLRIRRYRSENDPNVNIAIPETRIYGERMSGFYDTIRNFFNTSQFSENDLDRISSEFRKKEWVRTGGSYSDSSDSHLFNQMFNTNIFYGSLEHDSEGESESRAAQFEDELRHFQNNTRLNHFSASYNMADYDGDGNDVYYDAWGALSIDTSSLGIDVSDEFLSLDLSDHYEFDQLRRYNPSGEREWERRLPYGYKDKENLARMVSRFIKDFKEFDPSGFSDQMFSGIYIGHDNSTIHLNCCFGDDCGGTSLNTDDYRYFLRELEGYDSEYDGIVKAFVKALKKNGFVENVKQEDIRDEDTLEDDIKNFNVDIGDSNLYTSKRIGLVPIADESKYNEKQANDYIKGKYPIFLQNYINTVYRPQPKESPSQMKFKGFVESVQNRKTLDDWGIRVDASFSTDSSRSYNLKEGQKYVDVTLNLYYEDVMTNELYDLLIFLDNSVEDLMNGARYIIFQDVFGVKSQYVDNLKKVFQKYFI